MTPEQYRWRKDELIRKEQMARNRAQLAAVAVDAAREHGDDAFQDALETYRLAQDELEDLMHETGEYDG